MGSLQSISSLGAILMPLLGSFMLGRVSHLPPGDWRVGASFFTCSAMQATAITVAYRYFAARRRARGQTV
jgi:DHA1 family tetracycline resistance protein-like MFS transporter